MDEDEDKSQYRELFIEKTKVGEEFSLLDDEKGTLEEDGTVTFFDGISFLIFKSLDDFADHYFLDKHVPYSVCSYVGDKDEEGNIVWHSVPSIDANGKWYKKPIEHDLDTIDLDRPGSKVFSKPVQFK